MKIAIDLDDVLQPCMANIVDFHNKQNGTNLKFEEITSYHLWEVWGGTREQAIEEIYTCQHSQEFEDILPYPDAIKAVNELKKWHELILVTSRRDDMKEQTHATIEKHFPNTFSGIFLGNNYSMNGNSKKKSEICLEQGAKILIDDCYNYVDDCTKNNIEVFLFDKPWNKGKVMPYNSRRVFFWKEILDII